MKKLLKTKKRATKKTAPKHRLSKRKLFVYGKFLPAVFISLFATAVSMQPTLFRSQSADNVEQVLAYATNTSVSGLLSATNTQRSNRGIASLKIHTKLNAAAQAKANDMVTRDYWSHVTPDGKQPWWFITNTGYKYLAAGENLAYGFLSSGDTVTGWMNSPSHKANLLNTTFTEVGFGIANSASYVGDGKQTVVVAMYAKPASSSSAPVATSTKPKASVKSAPAPTPAPQPKAAEEDKTESKKEPEEKKEETIAITQSNEPAAPATTAQPTNVSRIQLLTNGNAMWSASAIVLLVLGVSLLWFLHKGFHFKRYILAGEHFITHHVHLDFTVLAIIYLGFVLLSSSGTIR